MSGSFPKDVGFGRISTCECWNSAASYRQFHPALFVGVDETEGRYADVTLRECKQCDSLWLQYQVEYEGFSRSGRWARRQISHAEADQITPETALQHIEADQYACGVLYFDGEPGWRSGPMRWDI